MHSYDSIQCLPRSRIKYLQRPLACHTCIHRLFIEVLPAGFLLSVAITFFPSSVGRGLFIFDPYPPASLSCTWPALPHCTCRSCRASPGQGSRKARRQVLPFTPRLKGSSVPLFCSAHYIQSFWKLMIISPSTKLTLENLFCLCIFPSHDMRSHDRYA